MVEIDVTGAHVTIDHDEIPGVMPAMQMRFPVRDPVLLDGVPPGAEVEFVLTRRGDEVTVTALRVVGGRPRPRPGIHDHAPHHGGVVTMVGLRHVEAVAGRDGRFAVHLTDAWRRPLPPHGWGGRAVLDAPDGPRTIALAPAADALAGKGPPLDVSHVRAHVSLLPPDGAEPVEAHLTLPLAADAPGAAVAPAFACPATGPRCTLVFDEGITSLSIVPGTMHAALGIMNAGVTVWNLETGALVRAFEAAPPVEAPASAAPHAEIVDALAVSPDGLQTIVASEGRLLRYATGTGRLLRVLRAPAPLVRGIVWHPDNASVVLHASYGAQAWRLDTRDGRITSWFAAPARVTAVAVATDGLRVFLGDERGAVHAYNAAAGAQGRLVARVDAPVRGLAVSDGRLVIASGSGRVETYDPADDVRRIATTPPGSPCYRLAASPSGGVACADFERRIRLHPSNAGEPYVVDWHRSLVTGLGWMGDVLVSADGDGKLAVWDASMP